LGIGSFVIERERPAPRIGTAGWQIPRAVRGKFPDEGAQLERYAARLTCVEINSSFYRHHRRTTYERWAAAVPDDFRFAVKIPKEITHVGRLASCGEVLDRFLDETAGLGEKRAVVLVQLPPSFAFDAAVADGFFASLRARCGCGIACEPRHVTWFAQDADAPLHRHAIARVAADPAICAEAARPGGWDGLIYFRLHGSPRTYASAYDDAALDAVAAQLREASAERWCIFDNTAFGAATANALALRARYP
jgi:uncharacterized protein YecE (DUF72 family)